MAQVIPFKGIRYNPEKINNIADVVTPPYDVIDDDAQKEYYERSPYNIIRLELGYQLPGDSEKENRYTRAAADYRKWLDEGVLIREARDAIYLYEQKFSINATNYCRTGFFARVKLEELAAGKILPHEETLLKPKADRLALMSACAANFSPVFVFYVDPEMTLDREFQRIKGSSSPEPALSDDLGERRRIWTLTDPALHQKITAALDNQTLYIADGHHRYETALEYYRQNGEKYPASGYILMYLVNACDPGMVVLPTHRIVHSIPGLDLAGLQEALQENFIVEKISDPRPQALDEILNEQQKVDRNALIMATKEPAFYLLVLRDAEQVKRLSPGKSPAWCSLDAAVLQVMVFQKLLKLSPEKIARQENITYTRDADQALQALQRDAQLVFLLNHTKVSQIKAVAAAGDKMPQKSTFFYPKLLTGLLLNDLKK
jgi:uncharacterized protein (DUF1015 family)